jgi:hypothetical protein
MRFGIGAGAVSVLATLLAVSPAVQGDAATKVHEQKLPEKRDGRRVQVVVGGGSHLGVRLEDVDKDDVSRLKLTEEKGALVKSVEEGSPAEKAGIKAVDVVVRYQGESVLSASQLARLVRETPSGGWRFDPSIGCVDLQGTEWAAKGEFQWCPTLAAAMPDELFWPGQSHRDHVIQVAEQARARAKANLKQCLWDVVTASART